MLDTLEILKAICIGITSAIEVTYISVVGVFNALPIELRTLIIIFLIISLGIKLYKKRRK